MARTIRSHNCCGKNGRDHLSHPETYKAGDKAEAKGDRKAVNNLLAQMVRDDIDYYDIELPLPHPNR